MTGTYVFITDDIHPVGGMQLYVAGKARYLKARDWNVKVFFPGTPGGTCEIAELDSYVEGGIFGIWRPPYQWGRIAARAVLSMMESLVGVTASGAPVIIESHTSSSAQWGELLAARLGARHVCLICNEVFRGEGKTYDRVIPFFKFKLDRRELAGISENSLPMLFEGFLEVPRESRKVFVAAELPPVRDVDDKRLARMADADWTICHVGRAEKEYVERAIEDVAIFARRHADREIQVVFVGDTSCRRGEIDDKLAPLTNVRVVELGNMSPIPREVYRKADVVIASSGCAAFSAAEGVPTVVADCGDGMSNGILGRDTESILFREANGISERYDETLERVLVGGQRGGMPLGLVEFSSNSDVIYAKQIEELQSLPSPLGEYCTNEIFAPRACVGERARSLVNLLRNRPLLLGRGADSDGRCADGR